MPEPRTLFRSLLALCCSLLTVATQAAPRTEYVLDLDDRHTQMLGMTAVFSEVEDARLDVHLPVWRTGLYRVLDPVGTVSEVTVVDGAGIELPVEQIAKSSWRVDRSASGSDAVHFSYRMYANSLGDRTRDVNSDHAFLNPGLVFVYADSHRDAPVAVNMDLPEGWAIASGMESPRPGRLEAPTYDRLVDSPIEAGTFDLVEFEAAGLQVQFAIYGDWDGDGARLEADVGAIIEAAAAVFGDMPAERYVFLTHSAPGLGGGTEYYNSTVVHISPSRWWDDDGYEGFLSLLAHEFFHLWNVKRFRPAGIARYDYLTENYTDLLWVAEGLTSYYDELLLARAGVIDLEDYRKRLARNVDSVVDRPGYGSDSLAAASFEAWTKGYHRGADRTPHMANQSVSFYAQGGLLGLVLDLEIRNRSGGAFSLDDVMRGLYERFPLGSDGYRYEDVRARVEETGGIELAALLDDWVLGTEPMPIAEALDVVGWTLAREEDEAEPSIAVRTHAGDGGVRVRSVRRDGPAWSAGVNEGDVLLAIDGVRIGRDLDEVLKRHAVGDEVEVALFRDGRLRTLTLEVGAALTKHEIDPVEEADPVTDALRLDWLGGRSEADEAP